MTHAWAVRKANGAFANDGKSDVTPALFSTRRAAEAWWKANKGDNGGNVVSVVVSVRQTS